MKFYTITYDLRQPGRNYSALYDAIKELAGAGNWQHPMESFWVIAVCGNSYDSKQIFERLNKHIDANDSIIVTQMNLSDYYGKSSRALWDWISDNKNR